MNPRAFDLIARSVTTSLLALGGLLLCGYSIAKTGTIDPTLLALVGPILGAVVGAHVSQNGASARSRAETLAVSQATGEPVPADPLMPIRVPKDGG